MDRHLALRKAVDSIKKSPATSWTLLSVVLGVVVVFGWRRHENLQSRRRIKAGMFQFDFAMEKHH
jgi:predicted negative regulator of RcsB-dependent stress response